MATATRGQRRHLVTLQNPGVAVPDGDGGWTHAYTPLSPAAMHASVVPASQRDLERVVAGTAQASASHIVTMDYHPQITTQTRLIFKGRTLHVTAVQNVEERDTELILTCEEVVA